MAIKASELIREFQTALDDHWGYIYGIKHAMWSQARQDAYVKAYSDDPDRELSCELGSKWIGHWVTDCSGLFAWSFEQLGGKIAHGSNSIWNNYCSAKGQMKSGKRTDGKALLPGTAVFTSSGNKHNHIGLYVGDGWVIEAKGTKAGVIRTAVSDKKWTHWGELKDVIYNLPQEVPAEEPGKEEQPVADKPTLRRGSKGAWVTTVQTMLKNKGYDLGPCGVDGDFGKATEKAVKEFQKDHGLDPDGVVGPKTYAALEEQGTNLYTVTIPHLTKYKAEGLIKDYAGAYMKEEGVS